MGYLARGQRWLRASFFVKRIIFGWGYGSGVDTANFSYFSLKLTGLVV